MAFFQLTGIDVLASVFAKFRAILNENELSLIYERQGCVEVGKGECQ